jgi:hypothetical protein
VPVGLEPCGRTLTLVSPWTYYWLSVTVLAALPANYANRGILLDTISRHELALAGDTIALDLDPRSPRPALVDAFLAQPARSTADHRRPRCLSAG